MQIFDDLTPGTRYVHNKTGVEYELISSTPGNAVRQATATIRGDGKTFIVNAGVLENLYTLLEPEEPETLAALPIGSLIIDAIDPEPEPTEPESEPELVFRRKGRPMNERRPDFKSYFGEPRKDGPNPDHWKKKI